MAKTLDQEQIDAIFASARAEPSETIADVRSGEPYNFGRGGQISKEQMVAIATVNDLFVRNLMLSMGAWLRIDFVVAMVSAEQMGYVEFVERIPEATYVCSIRMEPLGAVGLIEIEPTLTSPMVELLLGGKGRPEPPRPLTDIEDLIMVSVVQMMIKELNTAWKAAGLSFNFERREAQSQIARLMPSGEKTLCSCFEVTMPGLQGLFNICLPAVVLNTILRRLIAVRERSRLGLDEARMRIEELLAESKVGAVLQFAPMRIAAQKIATLEVGSLLRLPMPRHEPAELRIQGMNFGAAWPVKMGEHRGARIADLPGPDIDGAEATHSG